MKTDTYYRIADKIDSGPLRAPRAGSSYSEAFIAFLRLIYDPEEAELVQYLEMPMKFKSAREVAEAAGRDEAEVRAVLDGLAAKGRVMGFGGSYTFPVIASIVNMHNFREEIEEGDLEAALLYQEFFIEDGFYRYYESSEAGTPIMRVIPVRTAVEHGQKMLGSEEAHDIIDACDNLILVPCPCRVRTEKLGIRECNEEYPIGFCIMVGISTPYFEAIGVGRKVNAQQAKDYFDEMQKLGLVGTTENYSDPGHMVICLCCGCCCSILRGRTRWDNPAAFAPSNFVARTDEDCVLCGECAQRCFFGAITLDEDEGRAVVDAEKCAGCGVCAVGCAQDAMRLTRLDRSEAFPGPRELYRTIAIENRGG
jgi:electron transport complex protein RnfB